MDNTEFTEGKPQNPYTKFSMVIIITICFSGVLTALLILRWTPFESEGMNNLWQMFLNVALGAAFTTLLVMVAQAWFNVIQEKERKNDRKNEQEERKKDREDSEKAKRHEQISAHYQAIGLQKKLALFDEIIRYVVYASYHKEGYEDIQKIEEYLYTLRMYSTDDVLEIAKQAFDSVTQSSCGQQKEKIFELCAAFHKDLYSIEYQKPGITPKSICEFMRTIQKRIMGFPGRASGFIDIVFGYKGNFKSKLTEGLWYEMLTSSSVSEYNSIVKKTPILQYNNSAATLSDTSGVVRFLTVSTGRGGSHYAVVALAFIEKDNIVWKEGVSLPEAVHIHYTKRIGDSNNENEFDYFISEYTDICSKIKKQMLINLNKTFKNETSHGVLLGTAQLPPYSCFLKIESACLPEIMCLLAYAYNHGIEVLVCAWLGENDDNFVKVSITDSFIAVTSLTNSDCAVNILNNVQSSEEIQSFYTLLRDRLKTKYSNSSQMQENDFKTHFDFYMKVSKNGDSDELKSIEITLHFSKFEVVAKTQKSNASKSTVINKAIADPVCDQTTLVELTQDSDNQARVSDDITDEEHNR